MESIFIRILFHDFSEQHSKPTNILHTGSTDAFMTYTCPTDQPSKQTNRIQTILTTQRTNKPNNQQTNKLTEGPTDKLTN
jgi:hypothetical protein